jgi:hypothetical protein
VIFPVAVVATPRKRHMAGPAARRIKERLDKPFISANRTRPGRTINQPKDEQDEGTPASPGSNSHEVTQGGIRAGFRCIDCVNYASIYERDAQRTF